MITCKEKLLVIFPDLIFEKYNYRFIINQVYRYLWAIQNLGQVPSADFARADTGKAWQCQGYGLLVA